MTAPDPRVGEIQARLETVPEVWVCDGFSDGDHYTRLSLFEGTNQGREIAGDIRSQEEAAFLVNAPADVAYLLGLLREQGEALARVAVIEKRLAQSMQCEDREIAEDLRAAVAAANGDKRG